MIHPRHPVQQAILERLRVASQGLRYSSMRPSGIENDLFNYHLKYLVQGGLAAKVSDHYVLTDDGKRQLIEQNPVDEDGASHRFKIAALCLTINSDGRLLFQRRTRQPFAGEEGMIGGGLYRGEPAVDAARRRLREETGLSGSFGLVGLMRKRHFDLHGNLYSDIFFHVCAATGVTGQPAPRNEFGEHYWLSVEQAVAVESRTSYGSMQLAEVLPQLASEPPGSLPLFYFEEDYHYNVF